ncbi:hypothetical protein POM88_005511 [Heracleum sosnowskyi]|uniref:dUTP diphosphatase n=1 Tax=Heracleum sosnowskyi TaxID=360622 RepID=A0AAD8J238_9APIA|nr:hypothetical protein POM88_005511 [Heracleum sosnowskyi]
MKESKPKILVNKIRPAHIFRVKRLSEKPTLPSRGSPLSAGYHLSRIQDAETTIDTTKKIPKAVVTARALARKRKREKDLRSRDLTKAEKRDLALSKKKARSVITGVRPGFATVAPGEQTQLLTFGKYVQNPVCEMYLPDRTARNDLTALASNVNGLMDTTDGKQTCIFALGIMCCVIPHFEDDVPERIARIGFNITTVRLPSQAEEYGINPEAVEFMDAASYLAIFGLTLLFVFKTATSTNMGQFSNAMFNALKAAAGCTGVTVPNPYSLTKAQSVRAVLGSSLFLKKKIVTMLTEMQNGEDNINAVCRYVATILEYNEMSAVMFPFETLITTNSIILTDNRLLNEMMNLSEALELLSTATLPQYFRYLAPPEQAAKLDRARFPTLAAVGQKLKLEHMKPESVKNLVGIKGSFGKLVDELVATHKKYMLRKMPITLDVWARQICQPAGATILAENEDEDESDEDGDDKDEDWYALKNRWPVGVILFNHSDVDFEVKIGDTIAQLIIEKIVIEQVTEVDDLDLTVRGAACFGSTGV